MTELKGWVVVVEILTSNFSDAGAGVLRVARVCVGCDTSSEAEYLADDIFEHGYSPRTGSRYQVISVIARKRQPGDDIVDES